MAMAPRGVAHVRNKEEKACPSPSAIRERSAGSSLFNGSEGTYQLDPGFIILNIWSAAG
jgi:hypothetical protein